MKKGADLVPDVHRDVALAVVEQQVAWLEVGGGDVRQRGPLVVGDPRDGHADAVDYFYICFPFRRSAG
jgi:hypothetical protein